MGRRELLHRRVWRPDSQGVRRAATEKSAKEQGCEPGRRREAYHEGTNTGTRFSEVTGFAVRDDTKVSNMHQLTRDTIAGGGGLQMTVDRPTKMDDSAFNWGETLGEQIPHTILVPVGIGSTPHSRI